MTRIRLYVNGKTMILYADWTYRGSDNCQYYRFWLSEVPTQHSALKDRKGNIKVQVIWALEKAPWHSMELFSLKTSKFRWILWKSVNQILSRNHNWDLFHLVKISPKLWNSADRDQNLISSESVQNTSQRIQFQAIPFMCSTANARKPLIWPVSLGLLACVTLKNNILKSNMLFHTTRRMFM